MTSPATDEVRDAPADRPSGESDDAAGAPPAKDGRPRTDGLGDVVTGFHPWRLVRRDIGRKLMALLLATMLWSWLSLLSSGERVVPLDVRIVSSRSEADLQRNIAAAVYLVVPEELIVRDDLSRWDVRYRVRGHVDEVDRLDMSAIVEISPDALGDADEAQLPLSLADRSLFKAKGGEPQLSEFEVQPATLEITLARRAEAELVLGPVNVAISDRPREGYAFEESRIRVQPNRVRLSGPRSAIESLQADPSRLKLSPVDVEGRVLEVSQQVGIDTEKVDRSVTLHTAGGVVEVTIPVQPKEEMKELLSMPVRYENEDVLARDRRRVVSATETLDLKVLGPRSVLESLTTEQLLGRIILVYDWQLARLPQARDKVKIFTQDLPDSIRVRALDGRHPEIEYRLGDVDPEPAPGTAGDTP